MAPTLGFLLALLVFVLALVFAAIGSMPVVLAGMIGALGLAVMLDGWAPWTPRRPL